MRIGVFRNGWWKPACDALEIEAVDLPIADHPSGRAYVAELPHRIENGAAVANELVDSGIDLLLDNGGTGLAFLRNETAFENLKLLHEQAGVALSSHFIDPLVTALAGLDWTVLFQCLQSSSWIKAVWDRAQALELQRFGVPGVLHLPMAAPDRHYDTAPLDPKQCNAVVSFVGAQNTGYFSSNAPIPSGNLFAGVLAHAGRSGRPSASFYELYHDMYGLGLPVTAEDALDVRAAKSLAYFNAKLFYNAALCIHNRDRFVIFLKRHLGDTFRLIGHRWDATYGLSAAPPFPSSEAYLQHFRETAINLNMVNGNAESALNMRAFEITAAGGFMLCHHQPEIEEQFVVGRECDVFHNEEDLIEKIRYYLSHPDERSAIARAGQQRTLSQHLYRHRLRALLAAITPKKPPVTFSTACWADDFAKYAPNPDTILDCGANVGQTAAGYRKLYPGARIFSFEPVRACFESLRAACKELGVHPVNKAVGDHNGRARMKLTASAECHSLLDFQEGNPCAQWTRVVGEEEVEICTLDQWCRDQDVDPKEVDILKLDLQGGELKALFGATELLKTVKLVYTEVSFVPIYKDCPLLAEIDAFMNESGYDRAAVYPSDQPNHWGDALYVKR